MDSERRNEKTDLRVVKTREAIELAFWKLLETADYSAITVSAIAREARVSRKTFYAHYSSIDDLLEISVQDAVDEIAIKIQPEGKLLPVDEWVTEFTRVTLTTLRDNPLLSKNVMRVLRTRSLVKMFSEPLERLCTDELRKRSLVMAERHEYVLSFFVGGLCATYETWVALGQNAQALDEAADTIARAATQGVGKLLEPVA